MPRTRRRRKIKNIVKVPANFATISDIDENYLTYELSYSFDLVKAILADAVRVKITIDPYYQIRKPLAKSQFASLQLERVFSTSALRRSILNSSSTRKQSIKNARSKNSKHMIMLVSDLSSDISNTLVGKINANPRNASDYLSRELTLVGISSKHGAKEMESHPALGIVMANQPKPSEQASSLSMASILKDGIDPAVIGNVPPPMITPQSAIQGLGLKSSIVSFGAGISHSSHGAHMLLPSMRPISQTSVPKRMARSLMAKFNQPSNTSKASLAAVKGAVQPIVRRKIVRKKRKNEKIKILRTKFGGNQRVMFIFEVLNSKGNVLEKMTRFVSHQELVNEALTPDHPPTLEAHPLRIGINALTVQQNDKMATHVKIFRQLIKAHASKILSWEDLITVTLRKGEGEIQVLDKINNSQNCLYRAIALGEGDRASERFDSAVTMPMRTPHIPLDQTNLAFVSIFANDSSSEDSVVVRVMNIPEDVCSIYVTATDLSARCPTRSNLGHCRIINPANQIRRVHKNSTGFLFTDIGVKSGHTYRYECIMLFKTGKKVTSPIPAIHTHRSPFRSGNLILNVSLPIFTMEKVETSWSTTGIDDLTVTFTTAGIFTDEGLNTVVDALDSVGISSDFVDEIKQNKQEFQKLLRCEIERHDIRSGEVETFGVQDLGVFTDNIMSRAEAGVSEMLRGRQYRYVVRLLQRDPMALLEGSEFEALDPTTRKKYKLKVGKFLNPLALEHGTLPSYQRSIGRNTVSGLVPQDPFLQGRTGIEEEVTVFVPKDSATEISNMHVTQNSKNLSVLEWRAAGNSDYYDHFVLLADIGYGSYVIGTVASQSSGRYTFTDHKFSNRPGTVVYHVIPIYHGYVEGVRVEIGGISIEHPSYDLEYWSADAALSNIPPAGIV